MPSRTRLLLLLAAATGLGPFSLQVVAPALPDVARDLAVSPAAAQLMISVALAGTAVATIVLGTLSDVFGRRPVLLSALAVSVAGTVGVLLAPGIEAAVAGRFLQAAGASAGLVIARAVATDLYRREEAAAFISRLTAVMVLMPMVAPAVGGELVGVTGWRALFVMILALALLLLAVSAAFMPETLAERRPQAGIGWLGRGLAYAASSRAFWSEALFSAFQISAFFSFVGAAPFVMVEAYGAGPEQYGRWFIAISLCFIAGNLTGPALARRVGPAMMHVLGAGFSVGLGGLAALAGAAGLVEGPLALFLPAGFNAAGAGLSMPTAVASAVAARAERAGAASSLVGFVQFMMAGLAAQVAGAMDHGGPAGAHLTLLGLASAGITAWALLRPRGG